MIHIMNCQQINQITNQFKAANKMKTLSKYTIQLKEIHMNVKFSCNLFVQYIKQNQPKTCKQIKIDNKRSKYIYNETIEIELQHKDNRNNKSEDFVLGVIKFKSNKGLSFIAGSIVIKSEDLKQKQFEEIRKVQITKSSDPDAFCLLKILPLEPQVVNFEEDLEKQSLNSKGKYDKLEENNLKKFQQRIKYLENQLDFRTSSEYSPVKELGLVKTQTLSSERFKSQASKRSFDEISMNEKLLRQKIDSLEEQNIKSSILYEKQKEIIQFFERKQIQISQQKKQQKETIKRLSSAFDDKSQKLRQIQTQKMKLEIQLYKVEKQVGQMGQAMLDIMNNTFKKVKKLLVNEKNKKKLESFMQVLSSDNINRQEQQFTFKSGSDLSGAEFSISQIKDQSKREASIFQGDIFNFNNNNFTFEAQSSPITFARNYIDKITIGCSKIQQVVKYYHKQLSTKIGQVLEKNNLHLIERQHYEQNEEYLTNYLEQMQQSVESLLNQNQAQSLEINKFHDQNAELKEVLKQKIDQRQFLDHMLQENKEKLDYYEQVNGNLEHQIAQLKQQLHQNNYDFSQRQDQYKKKINNLETQELFKSVSPRQLSNGSPIHNRINSRSPKTCKKTNNYTNYYMEQQKLELLEQLRQKELQIDIKNAEMQRLHEYIYRLEQQIEETSKFLDQQDPEPFMQFDRPALTIKNKQNHLKKVSLVESIELEEEVINTRVSMDAVEKDIRGVLD